MLSRWLNAQPVVNRPVMVGYMVGPNADEADTMTDAQLKDKGKKPFLRMLFIVFRGAAL